MGSTAARQDTKLPKGKTGLVGPAAPPAPAPGGLGPPPPPNQCQVVWVDKGTLARATHESRSTFVANAFEAVKDRISGHMCPKDCPDQRVDFHVTLRFVGHTDTGIPQWIYKTEWQLQIFCYEDERRTR